MRVTKLPSVFDYNGEITGEMDIRATFLSTMAAFVVQISGSLTYWGLGTYVCISRPRWSFVRVIDLSHQSYNAWDKWCPTLHHFVTELCTHVHISVMKYCIVRYGTGALWDLWVRSMSGTLFSPDSLPEPELSWTLWNKLQRNWHQFSFSEQCIVMPSSNGENFANTSVSISCVCNLEEGVGVKSLHHFHNHGQDVGSNAEFWGDQFKLNCCISNEVVHIIAVSMLNIK